MQRIPKELRRLLSKMGKVGGKVCLESMTPKERTSRAKLAAAASARVRSKAAKAKRARARKTEK